MSPPSEHHHDVCVEIDFDTNDVKQQLQRLGAILTKMSAAMDALTANVAKLSTDVDTLLARPAGPSEADVQAQADQVAAIDAKVTAALGQ